MLYTVEQTFSLSGGGYRVTDPNGQVIIKVSPKGWLLNKWKCDHIITDGAGNCLMELHESSVTKHISRITRNGQPLATATGRPLLHCAVEFHVAGNYRADVDTASRQVTFRQDDRLAALGRTIDFKLLKCFEVDIQPGYEPTFILAVMLMVKGFLA